MDNQGFNIAAVERDTGLSKDVLRVWERRYGFPEPWRDQHGERIYPLAQVDRLRVIKRLMDQGHRPGKLIGMSDEALSQLAPRRPVPQAVVVSRAGSADLDGLLAFIQQHDAHGYAQALQQRLLRHGLMSFVQDVVAPMTFRVGQAWEDGQIQVFEEHLFTELTKRVLRQAIAGLPLGQGWPRVLLTSVPEEQHILGLLMVEALFALEGAECIPLGGEMPVSEIVRAAEAHRADIVALSFSAAFPSRRLPALLDQLRLMLPPDTALWVGGGGAAMLPGLDGVRRFSSLQDGVAAIADWRRANLDT